MSNSNGFSKALGEMKLRGGRVAIMGCEIDNLTMEETLVAIERLIADGRPTQHVVVNVDKLVKASADPGLCQIINNCAIVNVDGMPVVWASHLLGQPLKERVAGIDLFEQLMCRAAAKRWRVFLLGAREEVVARVKELYLKRFPSLSVVGYRNGYWSTAEEPLVVQQISAAKPDILFVAISSPMKEEFLSRYQSEMGVPFAMGVGGTFDVVSGRVRRAPRWMQQFGLEWFFRFLQEPRRMFKRYFIHDLRFVWLLAFEMMNRRTRRGGS